MVDDGAQGRDSQLLGKNVRLHGRTTEMEDKSKGGRDAHGDAFSGLSCFLPTCTVHSKVTSHRGVAVAGQTCGWGT